METINVTQARNDLFRVMDSVLEGKRAVITSKKGNAVLMSEEEWNEILETMSYLIRSRHSSRGHRGARDPHIQAGDDGLEKYLLTFSRQAQKDVGLLAGDKLSGKAKEILEILERNPMQDPPPYEKLRGELDGMYSRRINSNHRIVYELRDYDGPEYKGAVHIVRMRTHCKGMPSVLFL